MYSYSHIYQISDTYYKKNSFGGPKNETCWEICRVSGLFWTTNLSKVLHK